MFTGIVEEMGRVAGLTGSSAGLQLRIAAQTVLADVKLGDSIAVNGVCLTVTAFEGGSFSVDVAPETRARTNLTELKTGDRVNLERSLTPTTRLGGHIVQGHVDGVATIDRVRADGEALWFGFHAPAALLRYIVTKGYVCLDGASLTVVEEDARGFAVMLVPFTQSHITLAGKKPGAKVNLEVDILGKYIERFLRPDTLPESGISLETLQRYGFH